MKKKVIIIFIIFISFLCTLSPIIVNAQSVKYVNNATIIKSLASPSPSASASSDADTATADATTDSTVTCNSLLGNPDDEDSTAWLLFKILNYMKVIGPIAAIILSSIDYVQGVATGDEKVIAKANRHLLIRLGLIVFLFFVPDFVKLLLNLFGFVDDPLCGMTK
jgi:hypothetical protein